jgi:hypothetical protein
MLNLSKNVNIGQSFNEIFIKFNLNNFFGIVFNLQHEYYDFEIKRKFYQQKTSDVNIYVQLHIKLRYDKSHTPFLFNIGDSAFFNFY